MAFVRPRRRFCPYCGMLIDGAKRTCDAHSDLPMLDNPELVGVESPQSRPRGEATTPRKGKGS